MQDSKFETWLNFSYLTKSNQTYIHQIYEDFLKDPNSVDISWRNIFKKWFAEKQFFNSYQSSMTIPLNKSDFVSIKLAQLINAFRIYGHQYSTLDPLKLFSHKCKNSFLELEYYKFTSQDFQKPFNATDFGIKKGIMTVENIYTFLKKTYCGSIGIEYMHILDADKVLWIQDYCESKIAEFNGLCNTEQKQCLQEIIAAEKLEHYLGIKFPGTKRFSLEGGDVFIPMLKEIIRYSTINHNIQDICIGMAHRGRLNVLVNVLGKNPKDLFNEFCNKNLTCIGSGDVKYHQGLYSDITINKNTISVSLLYNPSHLEIVTPIVMGAARAKIDQLFDNILQSSNNQKNKSVVLPVVVHGDAAISGQGIVQEALNMSNTYAYNVRGTLHIVINNQIGFTTSNISSIRSTPYCTDIAKMIQAPIFHVNADDVDAVIFVTRFALIFRNKFKSDVIIDLVCYRRHGHNEADEPSVTQPIMYQKIRNHPTVSTIYSNKLNRSGIINCNEINSIINMYTTQLEQKSCVLKKWQPVRTRSICYSNHIHKCKKIINTENIIDNNYLKNLAHHISKIPSNIIMNDRVNKIYSDRIEMALEKKLFDWGAAEVLAYATLLDQGYSIRLSGEDVTRGTFFHRHVIIHDQNNGKTYTPLMNIKKKQGSFFALDSVLSEASALAFEYGYAIVSSCNNNTLVIWEAQFGDFSNGAQVVIDQFISAGEQKWNQLCKLVMLLPHGYEGQGPEHSSCRIERYLQLCAENNMWIIIPSTPAQVYHVLRKQANTIEKKPLIIVSPKSLLRHSMVVSSINDLAYGSFNTIFNETNSNCIINKINKVIICTGKIYYDLVSERNKTSSYNIAIIRIEQLYPFPVSDIHVVLQFYTHVKKFIWCQEEPKNQGAWYYIQRCFYDNIKYIVLNYIGRSDSASPAVGRFSMHQIQQKKIIKDALDLK